MQGLQTSYRCVLVAQSYLALCNPGTIGTRPLCPWDFPGKNTGVRSHSFLQGIFPIQGSNPGFLHCRWILYLKAEPLGKPPQLVIKKAINPVEKLAKI